MKHIGENIRSLRRKRNWRQVEIANKLELSIPAFSKIETGATDISISRLFQIADILQVSVYEILLASGTNPKDLESRQLTLVRSQLLEREREVLMLQRKIIALYEEIR